MDLRKVISSAIMVGAIAGFASTAMADMVLSDSRINELQNSGYGIYLGTFIGNDNPVQDLTTIADQINASVKYTGEDVNLEFFQKIDAPATSALGMTITYNSDNLSGTWTTTEPVEFYTVKSSKQYSIWWMNNDNGTTSGKWTTEGLATKSGNLPTISHLSTWNDENTTNVPEPTMLSLLGLSLLGVGFIRRKTK